jgi:hypothetical protein
MNINKTDFKIIYNNISSLSQVEIKRLENELKGGKTTNPLINNMSKKYSFDELHNVVSRINSKILLGGIPQVSQQVQSTKSKTSMLSNLVKNINITDLTKL